MSRIPLATPGWAVERSATAASTPAASVPDASAPGAKSWLVARLGRRTSGGRYLPEVDGLRFVSIALVVLYHLRGYLLANGGATGGGVPMRLVGQGYHGVELFFVISGFVLGLPFAAHYLAGAPRVPLGRYLLRRVTRLEPPYIVSMLLLAALLVATGTPARVALPHLGASLLYLHNLVYRDGSLINSVAWSLEVEVQFYLLAPLVARVLFSVRPAWARRVLLAGLALAAVAMQAAWVTQTPGGGVVRLTVLNFAQYFLVGLLLADLYQTRWAHAPRTRAWDAVALAAWPLLGAAMLTPPLRAVAVPAVFGVCFAATLRGRAGRALFAWPLVSVLGGMCYSIYLLHYPVIAAVGRATAGVRFPGWPLAELAAHLALVAGPLLLVCGGLFVLVERPCMDPRWPARARERLAAAAGRATRLLPAAGRAGTQEAP